MVPIYPDYDPDKPASRENPWYIDIVDPDKEIGVRFYDRANTSSGQVYFKDMADNIHEWHLNTEPESEEGKLISPGSHGFAVAIGKRLVDFFGGSVVYNDSVDDSPNYKVNPRKAKFPPKTKDQTSDDRWYQFYNALSNEPMLSAADLKKSCDKYGASDRHLLLLQVLEAKERADRLEKVAQAVRDQDQGFEPKASSKPKM